MFIYNLKINSSLLFRIILSSVIIIALLICGIIIYKIYFETTTINDNYSNEINVIDNKNYANVLQSVHENLNNYLGKKIKYSGFVYRVYDLDKEQFVLGRNMIISSDLQSVVVGFLCHHADSIKYRDFCWVEIEATISKTTYHGNEIPILEITSIKEIDKPDDEYVYPPDENYIPTFNIL